MQAVVILCGVIIGVWLYMLPLIVANHRDHHNRVRIGFLNLFLGWTGILWWAALVWALTNPPPRA